MTQFACSVILHASAIRLCWRSIKAANKWSASDPTSLAFDDVEIPQLWTLLAFHTVYAGVAERLVSWLPFYYYGKMLLLLVTFVVPGTRFPNYWFTELLVPSIIKLHAALDLDWRTYLVHQLRYLPLLLLDLLFVPGILGDTNDDDGDDAAAPTPSPLPATYRVEEAEAEEECFGGRKKNALWCSESSLSRRRRRQSLGGRGGTGGAESREKRGERNNVEEFFFFFFFFFLFFFVVVGFEMGVGEENGRCERRRRSRSSAAPWLHHCGPDGHAVWIRLRCVQFQSHRKTVRD